MKKRFFIFMILAAIFVGCSSDSSHGDMAINEANLVGRWYLNTSKMNNEPMVSHVHECPTSKDYNDILSDHSINFVGYGNNCAVNDTQESTWTLDGDVMSILFGGAIDPEEWQITKLTHHELNLKRVFVDEGATQTQTYYMTRE